MRDFSELGVDFSQFKILVVDDVPVNLMLIEKFLQPYKFKIIKANNGKVAMEQLHNEKPDLMVLDVTMPEMDGTAVVKAVRAEGNGLPIIIMSAFNSENDTRELLALGAADFVAKPVIRERIVNTVINNTAYVVLARMNKK